MPMGESEFVDRDASHRGSGALLIDRRTGSVMYRQAPVELTATEFRILELLNSHPGWVFPAGEIADTCLESGGSEDTIIVHMSNLRGKLARAGEGESPIETVRGFGYRLAPDSVGLPPKPVAQNSGEALGDELSASGSLADAAAVYLQALDSASADDPIPLARLHMKAGRVALNRRLLTEAAGHSYEAEKLLVGVDTDEARGLLDDVLIQRAMIAFGMGEFQNAYDQCAELLKRLDRDGTPQQRVILHGCCTMSLLRLQRIVVTSDVLHHAWRMYEAWEVSRDPSDAIYAESVLGEVLLHSGNIAGGERRLTGALRMSEELGDTSMRPRILCSLGIAARRRGDVRLAERLGRRLTDLASQREGAEFEGAGHGLLCWVEWRDRDLHTAEDEGEEALRSVQREPMFPYWWMALAPLVAIELERDNLSDAIAYARHMVDPSQQILPPMLNAALGAACSAFDAGNDAEAVDALSQAVVAGRAEGYT
jgi:DNA-binding winged helix-turn-helix (wHTH) protein